MPIKYIPYVPDTVEGQAILDNITRTRRVLRYRDKEKPIERIRRGLPLYEAVEVESVGAAVNPLPFGTEEPASNLLIRGECLSACAYLKEQGIAIDLVYIDPPFASGADYAKSVYLRRNPHKAAEIATAEAELELDELRAFEEKMYGDIWNKEDYLNWMFENLHAIKSVMSETASIYVHLDWHIGHYVKVLLDEVFGEDNFLNHIIWKRQTSSGFKGKNIMGKNHDDILLYSKIEEFTYNTMYIPYTEAYISARFVHEEEKGGVKRKFKDAFLGSATTQQTIQRLKQEDRIYYTETGGMRLKVYFDEAPGIPLDDVWVDLNAINSQSDERTDYATQKPEALLQRIIRASSNDGMIVADFFGGSGVTAKVAHDLGRRFVHVDVGVNSLQTARDRLRAAGAAFRALDIQDGVSLFRNPVQTMDKLKTLVTGLKNEDGLDKFWEGAIADSKLGTMPVYLPNLLDHSTKVLDVPLINRIINEAMPDLPEDTKQVVVYYVDIFDRAEVEKYIRDHNMTGVAIELRDLKEILDEVVLNDEAEWTVQELIGAYEVEITRFTSDRLMQKIGEYNQKKGLTGKAKTSLLETDAEETDEAAPKPRGPFKPIQISDNGLELIEWLSLDCTTGEGPWHSDAEIKMDKLGFVVRNGVKTKSFWDAKITSTRKPLRLKIRNIAGDESVLGLGPAEL